MSVVFVLVCQSLHGALSSS